MNRRAADKEPSVVSIVERCFAEADDFLTVREVVERTELSHNRVTASLSHLHKFGAAAFVAQDDATYWYATPEFDRRMKKVEERVREEPGSRRRGTRSTK